MFLLFRHLSDESDPDAPIELSPDESRHARARRLHSGDAIYLSDGRGRRWPGTLQQAGRGLEFRATGDPPLRARDPELALFVAVPEGRRWDWLLQKATELGVTSIVPVHFEYSEHQVVNASRATRVVLAAAEQSRRLTLPVVADQMEFSSLALDPQLRAMDVPEEPGVQTAMQAQLARCPALVVGPEGGFSDAERKRLDNAGVIRWSLGGSILRVETAALAGLALVTAQRSGQVEP